MSKYAPITTVALIMAVQRAAIKINKLKAAKTPASKTSALFESLGEIRNELVPRLRQLDRTLPTFFPVGSIVSYGGKQVIQDADDWRPIQKTPVYTGTVRAQTPTKVHVQFEGVSYLAECDPVDLTLKYIR